MRVTLFMDSDVFAGTERHIAALALALCDESVDVSIACPTPSPLAQQATEAKIPLIPIQKSGLIDLRAIKRLRTGLRTGEIDLVHAHNGRTALTATIAVRAAGIGRSVMTQHFLEPRHTTATGPSSLISGLAHRWVNQHLDHVIAISAAVQESSIARGDVPTNRISTIANGLPDLQTDLMPARDEVRRSLNLASDDILVICVARLQPEKNISSLMAAMAEIVRRDPNTHIRCAIAGTGPESESLINQIGQQGLGHVITMLGHRSDAPSLIRAADMLVLPSTAEPFGLVLLEAMALAVPVIATRVGGPLEIVDSPTTGLLVQPNHSSKLARAIEKLANDRQMRLAMGQAGRERFLMYYTAREMAHETAKIYRKLIGQSPVQQTADHRSLVSSK